MRYHQIHYFFCGLLLFGVQQAYCTYTDDCRKENEHYTHQATQTLHSHMLDSHNLVDDPHDQAFFALRSLFRFTTLSPLQRADRLFKSVFCYSKETFQAIVVRPFFHFSRDNCLQAQRPLALIERLPPNITAHILSFLPGNDLIQVGHVSKTLRQVTKDAAKERVFKQIEYIPPKDVNFIASGKSIFNRIKIGYWNSIISEDIIAALKNNAPLIALDLSSSGLNTRQYKAITDVLKGNTILTTLNLANNNFGIEEAIAIAEMLRSNNTLTALNLANNMIGTTGSIALIEALKTNTKLTTLDLMHNNIGTWSGAAYAELLKSNKRLTRLDLSGNNIDNKVPHNILADFVSYGRNGAFPAILMSVGDAVRVMTVRSMVSCTRNKVWSWGLWFLY